MATFWYRTVLNGTLTANLSRIWKSNINKAAEARAAVNNVERRRKWQAFKQKALFWRKAPKPDL